MKPVSYLAAFSLGVFFSSQVVATDLREILNHSLRFDPSLDEARANIAVAESQTKISEAGHLPVVSVDNTSVIKQYHRNNSERRSGPAIKGKVNLYSWGAVESEIERDKSKEAFFQHKFNETQEIVGQRIGELYLRALRAKDSIAVYQASLRNHQKILKDLKVVTQYDQGRMFEVNEAQSRLNQLESTISVQERILYTALSQLSRYTQRKLSPADLTDPFANVNVAQFISEFYNPDITSHPTYQAQQKEFDSTYAAAEAAKARRLPSINLEGSVGKHEQEVYIGMSWDIYNPAAKHAVEQSKHSNAAAEAKLREIELDVTEKAQTAEEEMLRNQQIMRSAKKQIAAQQKVVKDTELRFQIAYSSLIDVLNAYRELSDVQLAELNARNDYRDAALLYLVSQSRLASWAGIARLNLAQ